MKRVLLITTVLLGGCASLPARQPDEVGIDIPPAWAAAELASVTQPSWQGAIGDEVLTALVKEALLNNHDLQIAAARLRQARATARIEGAAVYPVVGIGADARRSSNRFDVAGQIVQEYETRYTAALDVSWEVDLWQRLSARQQAARNEAQAAEQDVASARLSIAASTARLWFALIEAQQQLALAEDSVQRYSQTLKLAEGRFERGIPDAVRQTTLMDVRLAQTDLERAKALAEQRREQRDRLTRELELLLGRYPGGEMVAAAQLPELPEAIPAGVPADVLLRRPDVHAAYLRLISADKRLYAARADLLPRLSLTATGGVGSGELRDILRPDHVFWNLIANIAQPLFRGGELRARVDLQNARVEELSTVYSRSTLIAFTEVEQALAAEHHLRQQHAHLLAARDAAEAAERLANDRLEQNLIGTLDLLQVTQRTLNARGSVIQNARLILENRIDLYLALGGDVLPEAVAVQQTAAANGRSEP
jgi:outer membrane protein, multidrug efflux system